MKHVLTMMTLGALVLLSACGKGGDSSSSTTATYEVNGKQPADYYRQFLYRETGECGTIHEAHHYARSETTKIGVTPNGKDVLAVLSLLMQADGTYSAFYQEIVVRSYFDSGYYWDSHQERVISGRWSIEGPNLVLSSLGQASALEYNGHAAMQLRVDTDLMRPGLKGQTLVLQLGAASNNPIPALDPCAGK